MEDWDQLERFRKLAIIKEKLKLKTMKEDQNQKMRIFGPTQLGAARPGPTILGQEEVESLIPVGWRSRQRNQQETKGQFLEIRTGKGVEGGKATFQFRGFPPLCAPIVPSEEIS